MTKKTRKPTKPAKPAKRAKGGKQAKAAKQIAPAKKSKPAKPTAKYILIGADEYAKPRAATFSAEDPALLAKAAETMFLRLVQVTDPEVADGGNFSSGYSVRWALCSDRMRWMRLQALPRHSLIFSALGCGYFGPASSVPC
jgi:hypothetical protein